MPVLLVFSIYQLWKRNWYNKFGKGQRAKYQGQFIVKFTPGSKILISSPRFKFISVPASETRKNCINSQGGRWGAALMYVCPFTIFLSDTTTGIGAYTDDPRPPILPLVMASSAMGSNWGSAGFCRTHTQKQTQHKCVHDLCVLFSVLHMFIFMRRLE